MFDLREAELRSFRGRGDRLLDCFRAERLPVHRDGDAEALEAVRERIRQAATLIAAAGFEGLVELEQYSGYGRTPRLRLHRVRAVSSD